MAVARLVSAVDLQTQVTNRASLMPRWRKALADVQNGEGRARYLQIGDSITAGQARANSWPRRIRAMLASAGVAAIDESTYGSAGNADLTAFVAYDPRWTFGAGWSLYADPGLESIGGKPFSNNTTTNAASFTPTSAVDTFEITYTNPAVTGVFTVDIDGATSGVGYASVNIASDDTLKKVTISVGSPGTHTLNIKRVSGLVIFDAVRAYNSAAPAIDIMNAGWAGSRSVEWNRTGANGWFPPASIATAAPHLTDIMLGTNDYPAPTKTPIATYTANIQALITAAKATGEVRLITPMPSATSFAYLYDQADVMNALIGLAASNSVELINLTDRYVSYTALAAAGFAAGDGVHPNNAGRTDIARAVFAGLLD